jgi:DNA-binding HxlR family transcriptional regulator
LERGSAGLSGAGHVERNALEIVSSRDRARIVSSAQSALGMIRGKWKIPILVTMLDGPIRLGQLRRLIPRASKKVLVQQLHELEKDRIIVRTDLSGKIKHVEYTVCSPLGRAVMNLLGLLSDWGIRHEPMMALHGRTRVGATPVLPMPIALALNPCR